MGIFHLLNQLVSILRRHPLQLYAPLSVLCLQSQFLRFAIFCCNSKNACLYFIFVSDQNLVHFLVSAPGGDSYQRLIERVDSTDFRSLTTDLIFTCPRLFILSDCSNVNFSLSFYAHARVAISVIAWCFKISYVLTNIQMRYFMLPHKFIGLLF